MTVRTPLRPTEDPERVAACLTRFLPGAAVGEDGGVLVAEGDSLDPLRKRVWELRIIDTFRSALAAEGSTLRFTISKQAAAGGKVSLPASPHPLGELTWQVELRPDDPFDDAEALAWWLCPETRDGEVVGH